MSHPLNQIPKGLTNLGNTCFLNACVQVLSQTIELTKIPHPPPQKEGSPEHTFFLAWKDLNEFLLMGDSNVAIISPNTFVHTVHKIAQIKDRTLFTGFAQNDVSEFLLFFIDCLHDAIKKSMKINIRGTAMNETDKLAVECYKMIENKFEKEYSEIMELFYGVSVSSLTTIGTGSDGTGSDISSLTKGKILTVNPEFFFMLDLPIPTENGSSYDIYSCLDAYVSPELLENEDAWYNEETKMKESVYKTISFWNFPNILVISFKRFEVINSRFIRKHNGLISFPETLDLSKYVVGYQPSSYIYDLYGVCNHSGDVMGGHYTSFVKTQYNKWFYCNDTGIEQVNSPEQIITPMAYCLFYRKKNNFV